ncbi:hypothetical protein EHS25_003008 [Saitozyma podzolica]|uniref:Uncharacterized protein n=1 Tax=Saitozyma podzolica TaxID=1890683 RepID=A0A427YCC2_9TREE|nr:hypothetical protein EHS25_003008 [Saitozyma podzolica]
MPLLPVFFKSVGSNPQPPSPPGGRSSRRHIPPSSFKLAQSGRTTSNRPSPVRPPRPTAPLFTTLPPPLPPPSAPLPQVPTGSPSKTITPQQLRRSHSRTGSSQSVRANGDQTLVQRSHSRTASGPLPSHGRKLPGSRRRPNTDGQPLEVHFQDDEPALRSQTDPFKLHLTPEAGSASPSSTLKRRPTALKLLTSNLVPDPEHPHTRTTGQKASDPPRPGLRRAVTSPTHSSVNPNAHRAGEGAVVDAVRGTADLGETIDSAGGERTPRQATTISAPRLRRAESDDLLKADHQHPRLFERRRSNSTGDLVDLVADSKRDRYVVVAPSENDKEVGDRESGDDGMDHASDRTASESSSITSAGSSFAATDAANHTTGYLDDVPLPWSTLPASSIFDTLGTSAFNDLITTCLDDMDHVDPQLLPPSHLQAAITEEVRLQTELSRLKDKHERVLSMRGSLSRQLEHAIIKAELHAVQKIMSNLTKATSRCDRLVRQSTLAAGAGISARSGVDRAKIEKRQWDRPSQLGNETNEHCHHPAHTLVFGEHPYPAECLFYVSKQRERQVLNCNGHQPEPFWLSSSAR